MREGDKVMIKSENGLNATKTIYTIFVIDGPHIWLKGENDIFFYKEELHLIGK